MKIFKYTIEYHPSFCIVFFLKWELFGTFYCMISTSLCNSLYDKLPLILVIEKIYVSNHSLSKTNQLKCQSLSEHCFTYYMKIEVCCRIFPGTQCINSSMSINLKHKRRQNLRITINNCPASASPTFSQYKIG